MFEMGQAQPNNLPAVPDLTDGVGPRAAPAAPDWCSQTANGWGSRLARAASPSRAASVGTRGLFGKAGETETPVQFR